MQRFISHHISDKFKDQVVWGVPECPLQNKEQIIASCKEQIITSHHSEGGFGRAQGYGGRILENSAIVVGPCSRELNAASFEGPRKGRAQQQVQAVL